MFWFIWIVRHAILYIYKYKNWYFLLGRFSSEILSIVVMKNRTIFRFRKDHSKRSGLLEKLFPSVTAAYSISDVLFTGLKRTPFACVWFVYGIMPLSFIVNTFNSDGDRFLRKQMNNVVKWVAFLQKEFINVSLKKNSNLWLTPFKSLIFESVRNLHTRATNLLINSCPFFLQIKLCSLI